MARNAILAGATLVIVGIVVTIASDSESVTSLIPAFIGAVFVGLGLLARAKPDLNHHVMHAAAGLALLGVLGSLGSAVGRGSEGWALVAQLATVVILGGFLYRAVQSFRAARLAREADAVMLRAQMPGFQIMMTSCTTNSSVSTLPPTCSLRSTEASPAATPFSPGRTRA